MTLWRSLTGRDPWAPPVTAGRYFIPISQGSMATLNTLGVNTLRLTPWVLQTAMQIDQVGAEITAVGDVGSKLRLGIYADNGRGYPGALVVDAGQIAGDTVGAQTLPVAVVLRPGVYWLGGVVQAATTTQPTVRVTGASYGPEIPLTFTSAPGGSTGLSIGATGITGTLPQTFPGGLSTGTIAPARLFLRTAT